MASVWEFIRRHRGKIVVGGVVAGGVYLGQRVLQAYQEDHRRRSNEEQLCGFADQQRQRLQNRKHYVFDSNQRTCDNSLMQILPTIKMKLLQRFDVESLADALKKDAEHADNGLDGEHRVESWNKMKIDAVSRLLSAAVAFTILVVTLKSQISILAMQIYENSLQSTPGPIESWYSRVWYRLGGRIAEVKPRIGEVKRRVNVAQLQNSSSVQQLFLQALQYFMTKGVDDLNNHVRTIVADHLAGVSLKEPFAAEQLRKLLMDLLAKVENQDSRTHHFSFYVVPLNEAGDLREDPDLEELLIILKTVLESGDAQQLFSQQAATFIDHAHRFVMENINEFRGEKQATAKATVPLARLVPTLSDAFHEVSRVNFDSVLNNFIISTELHSFCVKVFERDQGMW